MGLDSGIYLKLCSVNAGGEGYIPENFCNIMHIDPYKQ